MSAWLQARLRFLKHARGTDGPILKDALAARARLKATRTLTAGEGAPRLTDQLSRRALVGWAARGAAGLGVSLFLSGCEQPNGQDGRPGRPRGPISSNVGPDIVKTAGEGVGELEAEATVSTREGTQVFLSRQDLHPPTITIDVPPAPAGTTEYIFTDSNAGPGQQGAIIIDRTGQLVWFFPAPAANNLDVQSYRGEPVLTWFEGTLLNEHGEGHYELYDSAYQQLTQVYAAGGYQADLHELLLTAAGTAFITCYGQATADLSRFGGRNPGTYYYGVVQEVDVASGELLFQWRSDEHVGFDDSYLTLPSTQRAPWDYFHINSIDVDPTDGNLIVSSRNTWTAYKLDRKTGGVLWRLGGKHTDFTFGHGAHFAFQHDVRRHPDGTLTLFDDEAGPPYQATQSRGLVLALDEAGRRVSLIQQYLHSPPLLSPVLGSMQDLGGGRHFVGWGESSYFSEYDSSGRVVFDGHLVAGTASYRARELAWEGRPADLPALAVRARPGSATVYASWNGATAVKDWSVLGGNDPSTLTALGVAPRAGFETAITIPGPPKYIAVEALDDQGRALGRSKEHPASNAAPA